MKKIEVIVARDTKKTGHLFCCDCATELNVILQGSQIYRNPRYDPHWDLVWHDYHNVKFIFPDMLRDVWDGEIMQHVTCPYCSYVGKIIANDGGLFDIKLIKKSLEKVEEPGYKCVRCEETFHSQKCVTRVAKEGVYVCGDCALYA